MPRMFEQHKETGMGEVEQLVGGQEEVKSVRQRG